MQSYYEQVKNVIDKIELNQIIVASDLKKDYLKDIPDKTYYKILERMTMCNDLIHLTKGLYYRPNKTDIGFVPIEKDKIIQQYIDDNKGIFAGKSLYEYEKIVDSSLSEIEILSNNLKEQKKHIENIEIQRIDLELNSDTIPILKTLELLQNYNRMQDINKNRFMAYMKRFSEEYTDEAVEIIIEKRKYKKSTIAFMERILLYYGVENGLSQYLSPLSQYKIPKIEELKPEIPQKIVSCLDEYIYRLNNIYQVNLKEVILYGSYARGDYDYESDIDIMILLDKSDLEIKDYRHQLSDLTYEFNTDYKIDIKPIAKSVETYKKWVRCYPFYRNIEREGVKLYDIAS